MTETSSQLAAAIRGGDRSALARGITLVESDLLDHRRQAQELVAALVEFSGSSQRVGITGAPGVGKSTFIETLGNGLIEAGHRVAVLAVDPSSSISGGSILGDKTRMESLSTNADAYVRPSPTAGTLGGVASSTRESMILVEAAGYDVVLVETVGVGQSETAVAGMVDFFMVLMLPRAGDELQGIKKGLLELADLVAVNKSDTDPQAAATTAADYSNAMHLLRPLSPNWSPPVLQCSAAKAIGINEIWDHVERHASLLASSGERDERRCEQRVRWMWANIEDRLLREVRSHPGLDARIASLESRVKDGSLVPTVAADEVLATFLS